jgi:hypothetical protein
MKAIVPSELGLTPHVVYWTGRVKFHVGVVTYCDEDLDASDGVLQVPDDVETCKRCNDAIVNHCYPKPRR